MKEISLEALIHSLDCLSKKTSGDRRTDHIEADRLLLAYINDEEVTKAYDAIHKWYA